MGAIAVDVPHDLPVLHSELVLVCPELRKRALELLPEREPYAFLARRTAVTAADASPPPQAVAGESWSTRGFVRSMRSGSVCASPPRSARSRCWPSCRTDSEGVDVPLAWRGLDSDDAFEQAVETAVESLPDDLHRAMSNLAIVVEDEPPAGQPLLGLYEGIPLTARTSWYAGAAPDKISIYRGPLERLYGHDPELLERMIRRVVLHEIAHHFGISDERLVELDRY
jgi:predicted Zn-dependent protease with MMP-like domain